MKQLIECFEIGAGLSKPVLALVTLRNQTNRPPKPNGQVCCLHHFFSTEFSAGGIKGRDFLCRTHCPG